MTDQPEPSGEPAARSWVRPLLVGSLTVVVACLVSLVVQAVLVAVRDDDGVDPSTESERDEVMAATTDFVVRINTFGPDDLDASGRLSNYVTGVKELMTAKFATGFEDARQYPEGLVSQAKYGRSCEVNAVAVSTIGDDEATVLAAWQQIDSYPNPQNPSQRVEVLPRPMRWTVTLRKVEGEWLVDDYTVVSEQGADGASPSVPSVPPTGAPLPSPTGTGGAR